MYGNVRILRKPKIGFATLTSEFSGEAFGSSYGKELEREIVKLMERKNIEVIQSSKVVNCADNAIEVGKRMLSEDVDAVVVFVASWIEANTGYTFVKELKDIPVLFWSYTTYKVGDTIDTTGSYTGFAVLKGALERIGYTVPYIVGDYRNEENIKDLLSFVKVGRAIKMMSRARIGLIGYFGLGMYSATIDNLLMRQKIGPEIVSISEIELFETMRDVKDSNIVEVKKYLEENTIIDRKADNELIKRMISQYIAFNKIIEKYKLDAINPKCHLELSRDCMACIPLALLADRKIVTGCESDILVSVSMLLHYLLSEEAITYFDIMDFDEHTIYYSNCGFMPLSLAEGKPKLAFCDRKDWGFTGLANGSFIKKGKVDMLRLFEKVNSYGLLYSKAESIETKLRGNRFPTMKVELRGEAKEFVNYAPSQHISVAFSDVEREIRLFCKFKNIELYTV